MPYDALLESLGAYIGRTVTIFTTSGGLSGCGFTGVLVAISGSCVRLITQIGAPPTCPVGSDCTGPIGGGGGYGYGYGDGCCGGYNWLGSVTEIPICSIASFTHNAI